MKKNNKGFSLVELIIVIAILAILAGVIAPALIRYIDKTRRANDVTASKTIKTAVETALSYEKTFELLTTGDENTTTDVDGNVINYAGFIEIKPDEKLQGNYTNDSIYIKINQSDNADQDSIGLQDTVLEIANNLGEKTPRVKYKKTANGTVKPENYYVLCSTGGEIYVCIGESVDNGKFYQLAPNISGYYEK